jgi:hypothetical protein
LQSKREMRSAAVDADSEVDELDGVRLGMGASLLGASDGKQRAREVRDALDRAHQRLRLAKIVLDAGYPEDAIRAAQEAVDAAAQALEEKPEVLGAPAEGAIILAGEWVERVDRATSVRR